MRPALILLLSCALFTACRQEPATSAKTAEPAEPAFVRSDWPLPSGTPSAQPDLAIAGDGRILLSWIESKDDAHELKLSAFDGKNWGKTRTVARGDDWFVNWADTPHIAATGRTWWAHWLSKSGAGTYAYDVVLARSDDEGASWSTPQLVNTDGKAGEHGFVSMWPQDDDALGIAWLDGRNSAGEDHHGGHGGAMTLRTAVFKTDETRVYESELDARTCDCCQTAAARTSRGMLLAWRDRDENEIRDIVVSRHQREGWTPARKVHDDRWKMPGCPVNGPAVATRGSQAWVAWYVADGELPKLRVAHSADDGDRFSAPVEVDRGQAVQGRVGIAATADAVWVSWLREDTHGQSLWLASYDETLSREHQRIRVADLKGRGRGTGFPQLLASGDTLYLAWTDIVGGRPHLQAATVRKNAE